MRKPRSRFPRQWLAVVLMLALTLCSASVAHAEQQVVITGFKVTKVDENGAPMAGVEFEVFNLLRYRTIQGGPAGEVIFFNNGYHSWSFNSEAEANQFLYVQTTEADMFLQQYDWVQQDTDGCLMYKLGSALEWDPNVGIHGTNGNPITDSNGEILFYVNNNVRPGDTIVLREVKVDGYKQATAHVSVPTSYDAWTWYGYGGATPVTIQNERETPPDEPPTPPEDEVYKLIKVDQDEEPLKKVTFEVWAYPVTRTENTLVIKKKVRAVLDGKVYVPCLPGYDPGCDEDQVGVPLGEFIKKYVDYIAAPPDSGYNRVTITRFIERENGTPLEISGGAEYSFSDLVNDRIQIPLSMFKEGEEDCTLELSESVYLLLASSDLPEGWEADFPPELLEQFKDWCYQDEDEYRFYYRNFYCGIRMKIDPNDESQLIITYGPDFNPQDTLIAPITEAGSMFELENWISFRPMRLRMK